MKTSRFAFIALMACVGLSAGNFTFQALAGQSWLVALERSYFQAVALAFVTFMHWLACRAAAAQEPQP